MKEKDWMLKGNKKGEEEKKRKKKEKYWVKERKAKM